MIPVVLIISFVLDSLISNFISLTGIFMPLFTLMALIIIYPYFNGDKIKYYGTSFLIGVGYDLIYTDTIIIHGFLFLLLAFIITRLNLLLSNNYLNVSIMALVCIVIYRMVTYSLLLITANISFDLFAVFKSIYSSMLANIIYIIILYIITDKISQKFKIHKLN